MPGASDKTRRVQVLNANWVAGGDGDDGRFELMLITEDHEQHVLAPSLGALTALAALLQVEPVLAWDPTNRTLIAANLIGVMPWTDEQHQA
jgi:hypothetical protein